MIFFPVKYNDFHKYIASKFAIFIEKENPFSFFIPSNSTFLPYECPGLGIT